MPPLWQEAHAHTSADTTGEAGMDRSVVRQRVFAYYNRWDAALGRVAVRCPWCGLEIVSGFHTHEGLVKRSAVPTDKQHLIFVPENVVPAHPRCHADHGQTVAMTARCLDYYASRGDIAATGRWYVSLWREHGLSVPRGDLTLANEGRWREYLEGVVGHPSPAEPRRDCTATPTVVEYHHHRCWR